MAEDKWVMSRESSHSLARWIDFTDHAASLCTLKACKVKKTKILIWIDVDSVLDRDDPKQPSIDFVSNLTFSSQVC